MSRPADLIGMDINKLIIETRETYKFLMEAKEPSTSLMTRLEYLYDELKDRGYTITERVELIILKEDDL